MYSFIFKTTLFLKIINVDIFFLHHDQLIFITICYFFTMNMYFVLSNHFQWLIPVSIYKIVIFGYTCIE